jgi:hypothetical protein
MEMSLQAMIVKKELELREGHRMFTASSSRFKVATGSTTFSRTKAGKQLGRAAQLRPDSESDSLVFDWGSQIGRWSAAAATGLSSSSRSTEFDSALEDTRKDLILYITRKQQEAGRVAARMIGKN